MGGAIFKISLRACQVAGLRHVRAPAEGDLLGGSDICYLALRVATHRSRGCLKSPFFRAVQYPAKEAVAHLCIGVAANVADI